MRVNICRIKQIVAFCALAGLITPLYASIFDNNLDANVAVSASNKYAAANLEKQGVLVAQTGNRLKIVLGVDNFFRFPTSTQLINNRSQTLAQIAQLLRNYGPQLIIVSGHTDNVGSDQAKLKRSYDQAKTIAAYLWSQGIPLRNMVVVGCADTEPVGSNHIMDGAAANRRIEIEVNYPPDLTASLLGT